ncbi:FHA domain-containing protein PS1-like isoform X1 [Zingiber officinale]|uniref:FHA domain-containing protein PS1-like isoform X1 n=1 Tax=Zingiber officinale TaxID=94328 RepID=UPI001C4B78B5|nr:FHA domain-containing protein PS1-like isoform X1 [Zingiber officinale]
MDSKQTLGTMADEKRLSALVEEEESKIALLSVFKKGSIRKYIFLNLPPPPPHMEKAGGNASPRDRLLRGRREGNENEDEDKDGPILFGRHPNCHIVLDHPSVSRIHLAARLVPSKQKLSVIDLSSVHGTWISGTRIAPNTTVDMVDGDSLRFGASTRFYRLQWLSVSQAMEMENPLEPVLEGKEETYQEDCGELLAGGYDLLLPNVIPSAPPLPEVSSSSPLPPGIAQRSPERKVTEVQRSNLLSSAPEEVLNSSLLPSITENQSASKELEIENLGFPSVAPIGMELRSPDGKVTEVQRSSFLSVVPKEEPALEGKKETYQEDCGESLAGDHALLLSNVIPSAPPLSEVLSSSPLLPGIAQLSPERKVTGVQRSKFLSAAPKEVLNSSLLPSITEHQTASKELEVENLGFLLVAPMETEKQSPTRKETEAESSSFLSTAPIKNLNSSMPPERENHSPQRKELQVENSSFHCNSPMMESNGSLMSTVAVDSIKIMNSSTLPQDMQHPSPVWKESEIESSSFHSVATMVDSIASLMSTVVVNSSKILNSSPLSQKMEHHSPARKVPEVENSSFHSAAPMVESFGSLMSAVVVASNEIFNSSSLPEEMNRQGPPRKESAVENSTFDSSSPMAESIGSFMSTMVVDSSEILNPSPQSQEAKHQRPLRREPEVESTSPRSAAPIEYSNPQVLSVTNLSSEPEHLTPKRSDKRRASSSLLSRRSKMKSLGFLSLDTERDKKKVQHAKTESEGVDKENHHVFEQTKREDKLCRVLFDNEGEKKQIREEFFDSDKENVTPMSSRRKIMKRSPRILHQSLGVVEQSKVEQNAIIPSANSFKSQKTLKANISAAKSDQQELIASSCWLEDIHIDKENSIMESCKGKKSRKTSSRTPLVVQDNEEAFPCNKENMTPEISVSLKSKELLLNNTCARIEKEIMKKRVERIPLQSLLNNTPSKPNDALHSMKPSKGNSVSIEDDLVTKCQLNNRSITQPMGGEVLHKTEERKIWHLVVDANCFLDEESTKSLRLLEGLKGTHLIIPQIVLRELDCLKRRESFFSKSTKMASKALQWIEKCMVNVSWWIHVQSSFETLPAAPTPPISPRSPLFTGPKSSFSSCGNLTDIVSPTAEDHILDSALFFKNRKRDGQFVILSNSITLKIKAMAEGLLSESPKDFRASLVNPFSKRFLWANSSPRGSTWSCSTDTALFNNHLHPEPLRKVGKAPADVKGLKLILLHNAQFAQTNSTFPFTGSE